MVGSKFEVARSRVYALIAKSEATKNVIQTVPRVGAPDVILSFNPAIINLRDLCSISNTEASE